MTTEQLATELREKVAKATPGPWRSMRDGNQYIETDYIPASKCVGASRIEGLRRPWNSHALLAFGFKPKEYETVRFTDEDADYIALANPANIRRLLDERDALRKALKFYAAKVHYAEPDGEANFIAFDEGGKIARIALALADKETPE